MTANQSRPNGAVTADQAIRCLGQLGARCNLTALGAFLAVEPFA